MFWNKSKENAEERGSQIGGLQEQLQSEDNVFHRTIIALERLERFLCKDNDKLKITAIGTSRDLHDDKKNIPTNDSYYMELSIQCGMLYIAANYENKEVFDVAVEAFMNDLLEWYAGRQLLESYDEVDACVIPIIMALSYKSNNIDEIFQEYVYSFPKIEMSDDEKYQMVKSGMEKWLIARHIMQENLSENNMLESTGLITTHSRGKAVEGYKRIISALSSRFDTSAPLKMFYKMIKEYLPQITQMMPNINEDSIDELYANKKMLAEGLNNGNQEDLNKEIHDKTSIEMNKIYQLLDKVVTDILEAHDIEFSEVKIEIK